MKLLDKISDVLSFLSKIVSCASLFLMMTLICLDVVLRLSIKESIVGCYDIIMMLMALLVFSSYVVTQHDREMIHATFLLGKLPGKLKYIIWSAGYVLSTVVSGAIGAGTLVHANSMMKVGSYTSTIKIPLYPFMYLSAAFMFMLTFAMLVETIKTVLALRQDKYAEEMRAQWTA